MQTTDEGRVGSPAPSDEPKVLTTDIKSTGTGIKIPQNFPFRNGKAGNQQGVPGLSDIPEGMPGSQEQIAQPAQSSSNGDMREEMGRCRRSRMTQEDMEFFYSAMIEVRNQSIQLLEFLVRYDDGLATAEAEELTSCIRTIKSAKGF